ncbi:MAG: hypothetical protein ABIE74_00035 [Pseudomonadota bacterium]
MSKGRVNPTGQNKSMHHGPRYFHDHREMKADPKELANRMQMRNDKRNKTLEKHYRQKYQIVKGR